MKKLSVVFLVLVLFSCGGVRVNYDYEKSTDFSLYKTYNYYDNLETGLSQLDNKRLLDALDKAMEAKGYTLSDQPDFFIDIKSSQYQEPSRSNVGVGVGGTGGNIGGGISVGIPVGQNSITRQIVFDFVDESKKRMFWQAISESSYNPNSSPENREAILKAIVTKVLEGFPPEPK